MIPVKESQVQATIKQGLEACGLTVYHTSAYRQKGPSGVAKGVPDLLIVHPGHTATFLGLEVKKPGKIIFSSQEQRVAHEMGHILVVQSLDDALGKCFAWLEKLPLGAERQYRNLRSAIGHGVRG